MPVTWGISAQGFKTKDIHTIKRELSEALQQNIDPSLSCGPDTVAGQIIAIVANQTRQVWEMGAGLLASLDTNMAHGRALDALCALTGTYRRQAQRSRLKVLLRLAPGASLPKDSLAASADNLNAFIEQVVAP